MLIIVRGLPGSGKSTLAHNLASMDIRMKVFEVDDYFRIDGKYQFDPTKLPKAHADCLTRTIAWLKDRGTAIVSNTFTQRWEYQPYLDMAKKYGVKVQVIEVHGDAVAYWDNTHSVPDAVLARMKSRWEPHENN